MNLQPDISVITVNYNGFVDTCEFIDSWIKTILSINYEIIIVDNASAKDESTLLKQKYPFIVMIRSEKNLGFAGANNIGIKMAKGKYLFFLNNDIVMIKDNLCLLIERLSSSIGIAGVSPLIRDYEFPHVIQFAGYTKLSAITLRNNAIGLGNTDAAKYPASPTPYLHGAAMLIKSEFIYQIGFMPEDYFLYYEELDWCNHITALGYQLWYDPVCEVYHKDSKTTGKNSPLKAYYLSKNRLLYVRRNSSGFRLYIAIIYQLCIVLPRDIFKALTQRNVQIAKAHLKGVKDFLIKNKK